MRNSSQILNAFKAGDHSTALNQLYRTLLPRIQQMVKTNNGVLEDANDVFQDAVLIVYKMVKSNQFNETVNIEAYIYTIAKNRWLNKVKRDTKVRFVDELPEQEPEEQDVFNLLISKEREEIVKKVLSRLGNKCERLLYLIFYQGHSLNEVTEIMDFKSVEVTHTSHYRCKNKLRALVGENVEFKNLLRGNGK